MRRKHRCSDEFRFQKNKGRASGFCFSRAFCQSISGVNFSGIIVGHHCGPASSAALRMSRAYEGRRPPAFEFLLMGKDVYLVILFHRIEKTAYHCMTLKIDLLFELHKPTKKLVRDELQGLRSQSTSACSFEVGGGVSNETRIIATTAAGTPKMPAEAGAIWNHCWLLVPPKLGLVCTK